MADAREQRIEDTRAWIARTDRKLGVRTAALGAGVVLALAAGIVGVVLALSAKDESATKDEVRAPRDQVEAVQQEAAEAAEEDVATPTEQLDALEGRVNTIASSQRTSESELSVVQDDIDDLRNQISGLERLGGGGSGNPRSPRSGAHPATLGRALDRTRRPGRSPSPLASWASSRSSAVRISSRRSATVPSADTSSSSRRRRSSGSASWTSSIELMMIASSRLLITRNEASRT